MNETNVIPSWVTQLATVLLRKIIVIVGGALAGAGLVMEGGFDPTQSQQIEGAIIALAGVAWSVWSEWQKRKQLKAAIQAPAQTPVTK